MPHAPSLPRRTASLLHGAEARLGSARVVVGLDGFVDTILHAVKTRESATRYERLTAMRDFAAKIEAAAGHSANVELVTQMVKLGGNGPILANALASFGTPLTYLGNLGVPHLHPVFAGLARRATVHSIAEPGYTDAVEFDDGKLMFGKHESLKEVNWANLVAHVPEAKLVQIFRRAALIALVNWTMLTHLTAIWRQLETRVAPKLGGVRRWLFIDLADPAKRARADLAMALRQVSRFERHFRVILGMNLAEGRQVGEVLGFPAPEETYGTVTHLASQIRAKLKLDTVIIHPTQFAAAAEATGATHVLGPFTLKPKITTGAGDHFNAGFCIGRLLGLGLAECLQLGVTASGFYVQRAKSPTLAELRRFLGTLRGDA